MRINKLSSNFRPHSSREPLCSRRKLTLNLMLQRSSHLSLQSSRGAHNPLRSTGAILWRPTYSHATSTSTHAPIAILHAAGFLRDSALTWYRNHLAAVQRGVDRPWNTWEDKAALITHFTPISPERTAREKLDHLQQGGKSARTYAEQFNLCMLELPDMHEKDRVHRFLEGLRPEVRIHVELKTPTTLSDAVEWAIQADSLVWQIKRRRSSPTAGAFHHPIQ